MGDNGWIKFYKKTFENPVVMKDADHLAIWTWLLLKAAWRESDVLFDDKRITLKPGDLPPVSRRTIASELHISESKVQRVLKRFEIEHQIEQQMGSKSRLISIVSWNEYQQGEQQSEPQVNHKRTPSEPQVNTIEEYKNNKNTKNTKNNIYKRFSPPTIEEVRAYCNERGNNVDPEKFIDFYESKGWMVGKTKMKDWRAAVRNWERNSASKSSNNDLDDFYKMSREWAQGG